MRVRRPRPGLRRRDERGAVLVATAVLTCLVLMVVAALTVDLGNTWARRGQLQSQADDAAVFAASYLPATTPAARLTAAEAAVHYLACHPVVGQVAAVNAADPIPRGPDGAYACPDASFDPASTTYDAAAAALVATGAITFPDPFEISVTTPWARVDYGFAEVAGVSGTVQRKSATAHVYSPGGLLPMGASVGCVAAEAESTGLLGAGDTLSALVPLDYWSAGQGANALGSGSGGSGVGVTWPASPPTPVAPAVLTTTGALVSGASLTVTYTDTSGLPGVTGAVANLITTGLLARPVTVWFGQGTTVHAATGTIAAVGTVTVPIPAPVLAAPGTWHVTVVAPVATAFTLVPPAVTFQTRRATNDVTVSIGASSLSDLTDLDNLLSCAKPVLSPRSPAGADDDADLVANIRNGLDHALSSHPALVTAAAGVRNPASTSLGTFATSVVTDPSGFALSCATNPLSVDDVAANATRSPNCVHVDTRRSWSWAFTQGFLTPDGRLSCARRGACTHATFNGSDLGLPGQYDDDLVADYVTGPDKQTVLDDLLFTSLDTMIQPGVPVLTPNDRVSDDIYSSPRFFWAPVLTTVYSTGTDATYPVLTFRPAFITQESPSPSGARKLLSSFALELSNELAAVISGGITLLNGTLLATVRAAIGVGTPLDTLLALLQDPHAGTKVERHGLVVDTSLPADRRLEAVRVMNLNPGALPAVDPGYDGPVTDYLGSGPRVIRLVR